MSLQGFLFQQLFSHLKQSYQYLPKHLKVKNVLQCDTGTLEFVFIINHFRYMSALTLRSNWNTKKSVISHLKIHAKNLIKDSSYIDITLRFLFKAIVFSCPSI